MTQAFGQRIVRPRCGVCGTKFLLGNAPFVCESSFEVCHPEPDPIYAQYRGLAGVPLRPRCIEPLKRQVAIPFVEAHAPLGRLAIYLGSMLTAVAPPDTTACPSCLRRTRRRVCPACHEVLPDNVQSHAPFTVLVLGPPGAGKSHLIAAMVDWIESNFASRLGTTVRALGSTRRRFEEHYRRPIYNDQRMLAQTHRLNVDPDVCAPLAFELTGADQGLQTNIYIFDFAGEDLLNEISLVRHGRHVAAADAIVLAVSPLQAEVKEFDPRALFVMETYVAAMARLGKGPERLKSIVVAVVLTKLDLLYESVDPILTDGVHHEGSIDLARLDATSERCRCILMNTRAGNVLAQFVEQKFGKVGYFAVSSLGHEAEPSGSIARVAAHRVEEPLLWLLATSHGPGGRDYGMVYQGS